MTTKTLPAHGTYARANGSPGYREPCNCKPCTLKRRRCNKQWKFNKARGHSSITDATAAREHMVVLRETRTWESIAVASGVAESNLLLIANGQRTIILVTTHNQILAVKPLDKPLPGLAIGALGSRRRLQALACIGHSTVALANECRVAKQRIHDIALGVQTTVRYDTAERIKAAYERLAYKPPAHSKFTARTRNLAAARGWHGPLAWDDDTIDDPNAKPEKAKPYKPADKYRRDPDRTREIEHLYLLGESPQQIAKKLGGNEKYISDQLSAVLRKRAAKAERERLAAKQQQSEVAA